HTIGSRLLDRRRQRWHYDDHRLAAHLDVIGLPEKLFSEPNAHRRVSGFEQLHLQSSNGDAAHCFPALHNGGELRLQTAALDGAGRYLKPSSQFVIRTLERAELC